VNVPYLTKRSYLLSIYLSLLPQLPTNIAFSGDQQGGEVSPKFTKYHWLPIIYPTETPKQLKNFYSTWRQLFSIC